MDPGGSVSVSPGVHTALRVAPLACACALAGCCLGLEAERWVVVLAVAGVLAACCGVLARWPARAGRPGRARDRLAARCAMVGVEEPWTTGAIALLAGAYLVASATSAWPVRVALSLLVGALLVGLHEASALGRVARLGNLERRVLVRAAWRSGGLAGAGLLGALGALGARSDVGDRTLAGAGLAALGLGAALWLVARSRRADGHAPR